MKVAIVHDVINQYGGAGKVLEEMCALYSDAMILAASYNPDKLPPRFRHCGIRTS